MAYANTLKIFETLRKQFSEQQSEAIAEAVENALETNNTLLLEKVAAKEDIFRLEKTIAETKAELIKWMFIFWVGQFASIVGVITAILFAFFKR